MAMQSEKVPSFSDLIVDQSPENFGMRKIITQVPIVRPSKRGFIRTRPQPFGPVGLIQEFGTSETFLIGQQLFGAAHNTQSIALLHICIDRLGDLMLIAEKLPVDGRANAWNQSLRIGLEQGRSKWVSIVANTARGQYEVHVAEGDLAEPVWPEGLSDEQILEVAFRDRIINSPDHLVLKKIRGEV